MDYRRIDKLLRTLDHSEISAKLEAFSELRALPKIVITDAWDEVRAIKARPGFRTDCFQRAEVEVCHSECVERAIASVVTPGYEHFIPMWLDCIRKFGDCSDAKTYLFCVDQSYDLLKDLDEITAIRCYSVAPISAAIKAILYSCSHFINAKTVLALELDMLVVASLKPLWGTLENVDEHCIAGVRPQMNQVIQGRSGRDSLETARWHMDFPADDFEFLTGNSAAGQGKFLFNGGVLGGGRSAWEGLDAQLRALNPFATLWLEGGCPANYRDEFLMNLALSLTGDYAELTSNYNVQMYYPHRDLWFQTQWQGGRPVYSAQGRKASVLHFMGDKNLMPVVYSELTKDFGKTF